MTPIVHGARFDALFDANVLLSATARQHSVRGFPGPFSVKTVVRGEATWRVAGQNFRVDRHTCLVVDHGEPYDLSIYAPTPVETFVVFFADAFLADVATTRLSPLNALLDDPAGRRDLVLSIGRRLWRNTTNLHRFVATVRRADPLNPARIDALLRHVLDACADLVAQARDERDRIQAAKATTRKELHRRLLRGRALIDETFDQPFDLDQVALHSCLSPHHFHRAFRAAFEEPPYAYVARRRIECACRLLDESDMPVADVCTAVGYESLQSFTATFGSRVGCTPAAFRVKIRKDR